MVLDNNNSRINECSKHLLQRKLHALFNRKKTKIFNLKINVNLVIEIEKHDSTFVDNEELLFQQQITIIIGQQIVNQLILYKSRE